jgi:hypothetical protein
MKHKAMIDITNDLIEAFYEGFDAGIIMASDIKEGLLLEKSLSEIKGELFDNFLSREY